MDTYHKIQTVWKRDPATNFKTLLPGEWSDPVFGYLADLDWMWTEKVDGTNVRVVWDGERVEYRGKTDRAALHHGLIAALESLFPPPSLDLVMHGPITLYGEGYGEKIQSGGKYRSGQGFVLFDAFAGGMWLRREDVAAIADSLCCEVVPVVQTGSLLEMVDAAAKGYTSRWGDFAAEGFVARPVVEMLNRRGERVITKIKTRDFQ